MQIRPIRSEADHEAAVARIGMSAVKNVAMSTAVFSSFGRFGGEAFNREEFWRHSICVGIAAGVVKERAGSALKRRHGHDVLHLAGLLHDMGKIIFEQYFHAEFAKALQATAACKDSLIDEERKIFGAGHDAVGAILGEKWRIDPELLQVIRWHHEPDGASAAAQELVALVHVANYICNLEMIGKSGDMRPSLDQGIWTQLGLSMADIPMIADRVREESAKSELLTALAG